MPTERSHTETGWLIETRDSNGKPRWWGDLDGDGLATWTADSFKAIRFARKEDAERAINAAECLDVMRTECAATHHLWFGPACHSPSHGWLTIDSAPKDGTEIILGMFREEFADPIVMNSCWIDGEERGCYWLDWHGMPEPTHWRPLQHPSITKATQSSQSDTK